MKLKIYERTGIKEKTLLRNSQAKIAKAQELQRAIKGSLERGVYKENCKNSYDLSLMNYRKEYKKTEDLLNLYRDMKVILEENICDLIDGYVEYFNTHGSSMSAWALRGFRKNIERVIVLTRNAEKNKRREIQIENAVMEFVINHCDEMEYFDEKINVSDIMYLMYDLGLNRNHQQEEIKAKIKSIYEELKSN